jgi:nucleoid-associated protein YgaU
MSLSARSINLRNRLISLAVFVALLAAGAWFAFSPENETETPSSPATDVVEAEKAIPTEIAPEFDLVRISRGGTGVIAGRMAPGAKVELYANGRKVSEVSANEDGEWVIILDEPLEAGSVELNLKAVNDSTKNPTEADKVVVVSVPERDTESFVERAQNGVVAVLSPKDGQGASTVLQKPGVAAYAEVGESLSVDTVDFGAGGGVVFTGRSLPRVEVRLYLDDLFIGESKADDTGRWVVAMTESDGDLSPGDHILRVDQTVNEGRVQLRIEQPFVAGQPIDQSLAENGVLVRPGNTLWQIARQLYGAGVRYTLIFGENSEKIADPDLIYPGQLFRLPPKKPTQ